MRRATDSDDVFADYLNDDYAGSPLTLPSETASSHDTLPLSTSYNSLATLEEGISMLQTESDNELADTAQSIEEIARQALRLQASIQTMATHLQLLNTVLYQQTNQLRAMAHQSSAPQSNPGRTRFAGEVFLIPPPKRVKCVTKPGPQPACPRQ